MFGNAIHYNKVLKEFFLRKKPQCFRPKNHRDNLNFGLSW